MTLVITDYFFPTFNNQLSSKMHTPSFSEDGVRFEQLI